MGFIVPQFSVREINSSGEYTRYFHTKSYLGSCSVRFRKDRNPEWERQLRTRLGIERPDTLRRSRSFWNRLERRIPLAYLEAIGAELEVLRFTRDLDMEEFHRTLALERYPRDAVVRLIPAVYAPLRFPERMREKEAVEELLEFSKRRRLCCCINYPNLKTIFLEPSGKVNEVLYPPDFSITATHLVPKPDGEGIGTMRIGK